MLSEYSVRKPLTVFVAVILVIVLGVISFTGMITDLLPKMELPYVIVATSYPGASPEKVEQTVTRPMEASLGTVSGLKNINSISNENVSMIILEYLQETNMDSAMIELSGNIDIVSARLEDGVGTPIPMKISPEMIPIVVASVDRQGMEVDELSAFISDTVIPAFERIDGVASVDVQGLIEKQLEISIDQKRISKLGDKVKENIEKTLNENREAIAKAKDEIARGLDTLKNETPKQKSQLAQTSVKLNETIANLNSLLTQETLLNSQSQAFEKEKESMQQMTELNVLFDKLFPMGVADLSPEMYNTIMQQAAGKLPKEIASLSQSEMAQLVKQAADAPGRIAAIDIELQNINVRRMTFEAMKPQLESGLKQAEDGLEELESGKITTAVELAKTQIKLENSEAEIEKSLKEFDKAKDDALTKADLSKIITQDLISNIIAAQNFNMPAGYINDGNEQHLVKVGDSFGSKQEIENMIIFNTEPIGDINLYDIADIKMTDNSAETYTKVNGNDGVVLIFQKQSTASTAEVAKAINNEIAALQGEYDGLSIRQLMDQGEYINMITGSVIQNLLIGGALAIIILIIFLRDIKPTIIIALSIPISLMFAVTLMYFSNVTLNVISLSGLALGVGMLVDNSIVVIENIYRLRQQGMPAHQAAVKGAKEVAGAIAASTLTTICVFLPIVFTQGLSRQLFTDMGLTIAYSLLASLLVALTLVPAMGSTLLRTTKEKNHKLYGATVSVYEKILRFSLRKKPVVLIPALLLLALSIYGVTVMGTAFMPEIDSPQLSASIVMPKDTSRQETYNINDEVMNRILEIEAVETVGVMSGQQSGMALMGGGSDNESTFYILLKDSRTLTNRDVEKLIYEKTDDLDAEITVNASNMDISVLGGSGIRVKIKGQDLDTLADISNDIAKIMQNTEGTADVVTDLKDAEKETRIKVHKDKAMRQGLTVAQIYAEISSALKTESQATVLTEGNKNYPVMLVKSQDGISRQNIADYEFSVEQREGGTKKVVLGDIAEIIEADSLPSIHRENQSRYMTVSAEIADGYNIGLVSRNFEKELDKYDAPEGYEINLAGENETIQEAFSDLVLMIILAIVFIFLIMVAQFQSLLSPFIILFTIPMAFTGGLLLLWACNMELSVIAMLGFLILSGVVVNNGIVFVDYVNQLRQEGMEQREALVKAGVTRIRPILMTALTTILAMSTMALGFGSGAEMVQPMSVVTIGGLTYATFLTLLIVPVLYDIFNRKPIRKIEID